MRGHVFLLRVIGVLLIATAGVARAGKMDRPNLLVLLSDDQRMDTLGCYDVACPIQTPNLDRLASSGIRFTNGFATTPICVVSRACILTGRYECNVRIHQFHTPIPDDVFADSYPPRLKQAGYFLGAFGKYGVGISPIVTNTFDVFEGQDSQGPQFREYKGLKMHDAEWLTVKTGEFLDQVPSGQPFCLQVNYKEPHGSSVPAPEDDHLLDNYTFPLRPTDASAELAKLPNYVQKGLGGFCYQHEFHDERGDWNPYERDYFEKIASVERSVGKIMEMLKERGLAENTVVIFLSDQGVHLGEKQLYGKWTPYDQSLRIPFIIYDPRSQAAKKVVCEKIVLNIDVAPTLLALAGVPVPATMDGRSLVPLINGEDVSVRDYFFFEHFTSPVNAPRYIPRSVGIRTENAKYIRWIDLHPAAEEFYDLSRDPLEKNNLIHNLEYREQVEAARKTFDAWRQKNPSTHQYDSYGPEAEYGAPEIDWLRFQQVCPDEYARIKAEVERLGVTWEQAMNDWEIRFEICSRAKYWY